MAGDAVKVISRWSRQHVGGQAEKIAAILRQAAPHKPVGRATHGDSNIPAKAASKHVQGPSIDYRGYNT